MVRVFKGGKVTVRFDVDVVFIRLCTTYMNYHPTMHACIRDEAIRMCKSRSQALLFSIELLYSS